MILKTLSILSILALWFVAVWEGGYVWAHRHKQPEDYMKMVFWVSTVLMVVAVMGVVWDG